MQLKLRLQQILKREEEDRRWQEQAYKHLLGLQLERHKINSADKLTEEEIWKVQKPIEVLNLEAHKTEQSRIHMQKQILAMV